MSYYCFKRRLRVPEIFGIESIYGEPTLKVIRQKVRDDFAGNIEVFSFGWIYEGLASIDLIPAEVDALKQFIESGDGGVRLCGDNTIFPNDAPPPYDWPRFAVERSRYKRGRFRLRETQSGEDVILDEGLFVSFDKHPLRQKSIGTFLDRLGDPSRLDASLAPEAPIWQQELERIARTLRKYRKDGKFEVSFD